MRMTELTNREMDEEMSGGMVTRYMMRGIAIFVVAQMLVAVFGCSSKPKPYQGRSVSEDLEIQMLNQRLHQETMDNIRTQGAVDRAIMRDKYNRLN